MQGSLMKQTQKMLVAGHSNLGTTLMNSACIVPSIVLFLIFGKSFQFHFSYWQAISALCIILGFFYSLSRDKKNESSADSPSIIPAKRMLTAFCIQALFLIFLSWKSLNFKENVPMSRLLPFQKMGVEDLWPNSIMFTVSALFQLSSSAIKIVPFTTKKEWLVYGILGGLATGFSGILLLYAIDIAKTPFENALIYPLLSIGTIIFNQIFAHIAFNERLQWKANICFVAGIFFNGF